MQFKLMWGVMQDNLLLYGFPMRHIYSPSEPLDFVADSLHINPLKFLTIVINIWLALKLLSSYPLLVTGYIDNLQSDNTSAISWHRCSHPRSRHSGLGSSRVSISCPHVFTHQHSLSDSPHPRSGERRSRLPELFSSWLGAIMGLHYHGMLPQLSTCQIFLLPPDSFITADIGHACQHNGSTLESRAHHFAGWLEATAFTVDSCSTLDPDIFPSLLTAYLSSVWLPAITASINPISLVRCFMATSRLQATRLLFSLIHPHVPILILLLFQASILRHFPWSYLDISTPSERAFHAMCHWLFTYFTSSSPPVTFLISEYAVYDWVCLFFFTGSRTTVSITRCHRRLPRLHISSLFQSPATLVPAGLVSHGFHCR